MSEENTPLPQNVDLTSMAEKYFPGLATTVDEKLGIVFGSQPDTVDDLTNIEGIGPALANALNEMGIYRFAQIASWSAGIAGEVGAKIDAPGRIERENWVSQASSLLAGGRTGELGTEADDDDTTHLEDDTTSLGETATGIAASSAAAAGMGAVIGNFNETIPILDEHSDFLEDSFEPFSAISSEEKGDTSRVDLPETPEKKKSDSGQISVEDEIFKSQTRPIHLEDPADDASKLAESGPQHADDDTTSLDEETALFDDETTHLESDTTSLDADNGLFEDDKALFDAETTPLEDGITPIEAPLSLKKGDTSKIDLGDFSPEAGIFKSSTMPMDDIIEGVTSEDAIFKSTTMPMDIDKSATAQLQEAETMQMEPISEAEEMGIIPLSGTQDLGKSTTMPIGDLAEEPQETPKLKRPSQLKPKTVKRPSSVKAPAAGEATDAQGLSAAPKTVKLKRPGADAGAAPKTVKLKKAPSGSSSRAVGGDSTKKTVKLKSRPAPSGGLKLNKDAADDDSGDGTTKKKKKKRKKARRTMGAFWVVVSALTLFAGIGGLLVYMCVAYPEDEKGDQAMSMTWPLKGVDASVPFPRQAETGIQTSSGSPFSQPEEVEPEPILPDDTSEEGSGDDPEGEGTDEDGDEADADTGDEADADTGDEDATPEGDEDPEMEN